MAALLQRSMGWRPLQGTVGSCPPGSSGGMTCQATKASSGDWGVLKAWILQAEKGSGDEP